jgi:hypothetical protein
MNHKIIVAKRISADESRIFTELDDIIEYLQTVQNEHKDKKISLDQIWSAYEDCHLEFVYDEEETDEEYTKRIDELEKARVKAEFDRRVLQEQEDKIAKIKRLQKELHELDPRLYPRI